MISYLSSVARAPAINRVTKQFNEKDFSQFKTFNKNETSLDCLQFNGPGEEVSTWLQLFISNYESFKSINVNNNNN